MRRRPAARRPATRTPGRGDEGRQSIDIATKWLDWNKLGPIAEDYHNLIADEVKLDTRKLYSTEAFLNSLTQDAEGGGFGPGGGGTIALKNFADQRRAYLLKQIPAN